MGGKVRFLGFFLRISAWVDLRRAKAKVGLSGCEGWFRV